MNLNLKKGQSLDSVLQQNSCRLHPQLIKKVNLCVLLVNDKSFFFFE